MDGSQDSGGGPKMVWIPVRVMEDGGGTPKHLRLNGIWISVETVESAHDDKQRMVGGEQVVKTQYKLALADGSRLMVLKNHVTGGWYRGV